LKLTIAQQISMRRSGFTYKEIGRRSGESWSTIRSRLKRLGVEPDPDVYVFRSRSRRPRHDYPRWLIEEMYWGCGLSTLDIAYEFCMSPSSVSTMMNRLKIDRRSKGEGRRLHCARHPESVDQFVAMRRATRERATEASVLARRRRKQKAQYKRSWSASRPEDARRAERERRRAKRAELRTEQEAA
jgi:hypothetical protein